jgi:phospholipase B1, membrane-associated
MALGDSITAGAYIRGAHSNPDLTVSEWRGQSYAAGMDDGAVTIPNVRSSLHLSMLTVLNTSSQLIKHYNSAATGGSRGSNNFLEICIGKAPISAV